jgi:hypothetical protein
MSVLERIKAEYEANPPEGNSWNPADYNRFFEESDYKLIADEFQGQSRWSVDYLKVYQVDDQFVAYVHRIGATESQDDDEVYFADLFEVEPWEKTVTEYRPVA